MTATPGRRDRTRRRRPATARHSQARLAAVQALYQIDMAGAPAGLVVPEFIEHRFADGDPETGPGRNTNAKLFEALVRGVCDRREELDARLRPMLPEDWALSRLELLMRAILRLAAFELIARPEVPAAVVLTEYVGLAHNFLSPAEAGMVNAILDRLARQARPGELIPRIAGHGGEAVSSR